MLLLQYLLAFNQEKHAITGCLVARLRPVAYWRLAAYAEPQTRRRVHWAHPLMGMELALRRGPFIHLCRQQKLH